LKTNARLGSYDAVLHAVSADASRVYWTAGGGPPTGAGTLYVRLNADRPQSAVSGGECTEPAMACTLPVSETVSGAPARFWDATPDGSRAIYSIGFGSPALYEYDLASGESTPIAPKSLGVAGASEDLSRVYLASEEVCSGEDENSEGDEAQPGEPNLYLYEPGESCAGEDLGFVATLAGADVSDGIEVPSPVAAAPRGHAARATPGGAHLAFVSAAPLTGYDNADASSGEADREVYLYDASSGSLVCASCDPSGARPAGADLGSAANPLWTAAWIPGYQLQLYGRRPLSEDGSRLFFNSLGPLAPRDTNGAQDVYQWEAPGTGDCTTSAPTYSSQNQGCVGLISSGQSPEDSEFTEASADGSDAFFRTAQSLAPQDPGLIDVYDARVGGGEAAPAPGPAPCEGDACQSPPEAPGFPGPASSAFGGPGNPSGRDCGAPARQARKLSGRAKRLRRNSKQIKAPKKARHARRKSTRLAKRARAKSKRAKRCRRAKRGASR
jgi:hypothetical protein